MGGLTESSDYPRPCTALVFSTKLVCPDQKNRRDHRWRPGFRYFFQGASPEPRSLSDSAQYFHSSLSLSAASLLVLPLPRQKEKDPRKDTLARPGLTAAHSEGGQNLGHSDMPDCSLLAVPVTPRRLCIRTLLNTHVSCLQCADGMNMFQHTCVCACAAALSMLV